MRHLDLSRADLTHLDRPAWRDRFAAWFDDVMTRPGIYRWAVSNPFSRWFTQHRTRQVFNLMAGFIHTQVLLGCVRLNLLTHVKQAPKTLQELATLTRVPAAGLQRLVQAAVSLGLLEQRSQQRYGLGPLGAPVVSHPGIQAMIEHNQLLYQDMHDPVAILQASWQGAMSDYWPYAGNAEQTPDNTSAQAYARYSELMAASQTFVIEEILAAYAFDGHRAALDVGGGMGRFACELALAYPQLQVRVFDLPNVCQVSQQQIAGRGLAERVQAVPGDFTQDNLPSGADVITLVRIAHDHADAVVLALLKAIYQALPVGGRFVLAEPMASEPGQRPEGDAYFHFYLLAMGRGEARSVDDMRRLLGLAGFQDIRPVKTRLPLQAGVVVARAP
jgi:demethylspheroidene O-methyltransferase